MEHIPQFNEPILIVGFDGWGNALDISRGMADYMIRKLNGKLFGELNSDLFYRFDENRPIVTIENGLLKDILPPGGFFYFAENRIAGRDIILFKATEPNLRWFLFADSMLSLCNRLGVKTIYSVGSMYDNVLHTDTMVSGIASNEALFDKLQAKKIASINYKGPGAIHSTIQSEAKKRKMDYIGLWCHCPYYLQGTVHYGLLSHLGTLLSSLGDFKLDTKELDTAWIDLSKQIQDTIDKNQELQGMINDLRKAKVKGSWDTAKRHDKIIHLEDFLEPK